MSPQDLQFQRAEPIAPEPSPDDSSPRCVVCKKPTGATYFHAQGMVVCPGCAEQIRTHQMAPPATSLARAAIYGGAAAFAGCMLYSLVWIVLNVRIGLIAILVGYMVGRAIRHASHGRGGRPQQILAVVLTYFAISTSYVAVFVFHAINNPRPAVVQQQRPARPAPAAAEKAPSSFATSVVFLLLLAAAAPFLSLGSSGISGLIGLFIIFIGLQRAWRLTGRSEILLMGPYTVEAAR
jgi:hypothetical protein